MSKISSQQILLTIAVSLVFSLGSFANSKGENTYCIAVKALSVKLQNDLATEKVDIKLEHVNRYNISKSEIGFKGQAEANNLPINFDVKINTVKAIPTNVQYDFVKAEEINAALDDSAANETLTHSLLLKLKQDYKTSNIVIALDECNSPAEVNGKKVFQGSGEARIGFDWQKIDYSVVLDANNKPQEVKYKMQE